MARTLPIGEKPADSGPVSELPIRYEDLGIVAQGSFGEVRRVLDTLLGRVLAMKILHPEVSLHPFLRRRFFREIQLTAQLQHPGIVPVYDYGELNDGRLWYAMKEVRGTTFGRVIDDLHAASSKEGWRATATGWTFRRAVDALARIAQTVAYAHRAGIVHRDVKPENLMVGELGEVHVMDWGLACRTNRPRASSGEDAPGSGGLWTSADETRLGDVLGTPAFMPPEQALGQRDLHGPHSDVYSLGAVLYNLLAGRPPYSGHDVLHKIRAGPPRALAEAASEAPPHPEELLRACEQAMSRTIDARGTAELFAGELVAWLDGVRRREQALIALKKAQAVAPEIAHLRDGAESAELKARSLLSTVKPFDPVDVKRPAWKLEDEAAQLRLSATLAETKWREAVHAALLLDGELPEAHAMLADHYRDALLRAERAHRAEDAARFEEMLRSHDRGQHAAFLRGEGALTLVTDPPGAEVTLHRYELSDRRLVPVFERSLGATPLIRVPVRKGSYLCVIRSPGRAEVRYPILIERDNHWDGVRPGDSAPYPIVLPEAHELAENDIYVPAGFCWSGGDPEAADSLPSRRVWLDAFVIRRAPVKVSEYIEFLNDLVLAGREAEALAAVPRGSSGPTGPSEKHLAFERDSRGRFFAMEKPLNTAMSVWQPDRPVTHVDWHAASTFTRWLAEKAKKPWRLPNEIEREKAARGVDGRSFPWGNHGDPTFACVADGYRGVPGPEPSGSHPIDESPYGARGLSGNVREWCGNLWTKAGPRILHGLLQDERSAPSETDFCAVRGGFWGHPIEGARAAGRFGARPRHSRFSVGLRPLRDYAKD